MNIGDSLLEIFKCKEHTDFVEKFSKNKYLEYLSIKEKDGSWTNSPESFHSYDSYKVISSKVIRISYIYGYGEREYSSYFDYDITPDIREDNISDILSK